MKVGIDLDGVVYAYPEIFKVLIDALAAAGCEVYCISNHTQQQWEQEDVAKLSSLGIAPDRIDRSLLSTDPNDGLLRGPETKARMCAQVDFAFDDAADAFQRLTKTPIFRVPPR